MINSGSVELLDNKKMINQLLNLERKTARSGKDSIDHGTGGHDDLINAVAGAAWCAAESQSNVAGIVIIDTEPSPWIEREISY